MCYHYTLSHPNKQPNFVQLHGKLYWGFENLNDIFNTFDLHQLAQIVHAEFAADQGSSWRT